MKMEYWILWPASSRGSFYVKENAKCNLPSKQSRFVSEASNLYGYHPKIESFLPMRVYSMKSCTSQLSHFLTGIYIKMCNGTAWNVTVSWLKRQSFIPSFVQGFWSSSPTQFFCDNHRTITPLSAMPSVLSLHFAWLWQIRQCIFSLASIARAQSRQ